MMIEKRGIDVSKHNGVIDWERVKAAGVEFALLRCGYGVENPAQKDLQFERNYAECRRVGIPVGAYHYSYAVNAEGAEREAEFCLKLIKGKQFEYPVFFDIEERRQVNIGNCDALVRAFCDKLEKAGYFAGVYSYDAFFGSNLSRDIPSRYAAACARLGAKPKFVKDYGIWQHSWTGRIDGISGDVDMDICYRDFPAEIKAAGLNGFKKPSGSCFVKVGSFKSREEALDFRKSVLVKYPDTTVIDD